MERESLTWLDLTADLLNAPDLRAPPGDVESMTGTQGATESPLCDPRLDDLIANTKDICDCIVISHIPLSQQDAGISQEVNETRIWIAGSGRYGEVPPGSGRPSAGEMRSYLEGYVELIKKIHEEEKSLLFHPHLFAWEHASPPICRSLMRGRYRDPPSGGSPLPESLVEYQEWLGYHKTSRVDLYERAQVDQIWKRVEDRRREKEIGLAEDAEKQLRSQHSDVHDYLCWMLDGDQPRQRWSTFLACPTGLLHHPATEGVHFVSPTIVGMFWIAIVGRRRWRWSDAQEAELKLLRTVWTLLVSDHYARRQSATRQLGRQDILSAVSHDLKRLVGAVDSSTAPDALTLIREYLTSMLTPNILNPDRAIPEPSAERQLGPLCMAAAEKAARLECIVALTRSKLIKRPEEMAAGIERALSDLHRLLDNTLSHLAAETYFATTRQQEAFHLALVVAFRNLISNTEQHGDAEARVEVKRVDDVLEIRNIYRTSAASTVISGSPTGTKGSLRFYAGLYAPAGGGRDMVCLDRESAEPLALSEVSTGGRKFKVMETWLTKLPLPQPAKGQQGTGTAL